MSRRGNCVDNAAMESWVSTVKAELGETFELIHRGKELLFDYIEVFYNQQCRHSAIEYLSPARYERKQSVYGSGSSPRRRVPSVGITVEG